jgi:hypothetical protein
MSTLLKGIGRRQFLLASSGTALAVMAFGQDAFTVPAGQSAAADLPFSIGFVDADLMPATGDDQRFRANAAAADRMTSGDGSFIRNGARISVKAAHVTPRSASGRAAIDITVQYDISDGGAPRQVPFYAVSYRKSAGAVIPNSSFRVPLNPDQNVAMVIASSGSGTTTAASTASATTMRSRRSILDALKTEPKPGEVKFALATNGGPKLRRGFYVVAFPAAGAATPDWSSIQLQRDFELYQMKGFTPSKVDFEYVVLAVDYDIESTPQPVGRAERRSR